MNCSAKTTQKLLSQYEKLSPLEQTVLQLCSIALEPLKEEHLERCLTQLTYPFQEARGRTAPSLAGAVQRLRELKLLSRELKCNECIVEIATRSTLPEYEQCLLDRDRVKAGLMWTDTLEPQDRKACSTCHVKLEHHALRYGDRLLCPCCVEIELRKLCHQEDLAGRSQEELLKALQPEGDLFSRLTVLWRFQELIPRFTRAAGDAEQQLLAGLLDNLGYEPHRPLAEAVYLGVARNILALGQDLLPMLEDVVENGFELQQVHALSVAMELAASGDPLKLMFKKALLSGNPRVKGHALKLLFNSSTRWSKALLGKRQIDPRLMIEAGDPCLKIFLSDVKSPAGTLPPHRFTPGRFGEFASVLQDHLPMEMPGYPHYYHKTPSRVLRDFRIAVYARDVSAWEKLVRSVRNSTSPHLEILLSQSIFNNPFHEPWFSRLPLSLKVYALSMTLPTSVFRLTPAVELTEYAVKSDMLKQLTSVDAVHPLYLLGCRLLLDGRLEEVPAVVESLTPSLHSHGLLGSMLFLRGRYAEALESFEQDLRVIRKKTNTRKPLFSGLTDAFYVLTLLALKDPAEKKKAEAHIKRLLTETVAQSTMRSISSALLAIHHISCYEHAQARVHISPAVHEAPHLGTFFHLLASYWLEGKLEEKVVDVLSRMFIQARADGFGWLARECAEILCIVEEATPVRQHFIETFAETTGTVSVLPLIKIEERWAATLNALKHVASGDRSQDSRVPENRLIWLLWYKNEEISLQPIEQKKTAKGAWSRGRNVALSRLQEGRNLDYLSKQDHRVRAAIRKINTYYYNNEYELDLSVALPALVGHPLVFLQENPDVAVEIVKGEPELRVKKVRSGFSVTFNTPVTRNRVTLVRETQTRFKVIELSEEHLKLAELLGEKGLSVPARGRDELLSAVEKISGLVMVHSDIGGQAMDILEVEADSTPHLHLLPYGDGFKVEMFAKPFKDGGPILKPGRGGENLIADVAGKRVQTRRDLKLEKEKADAVERGCSALSGSEQQEEREWVLDLPEDCLQLLLEVKAMQDSGQVVVNWPEGEKFRVSREVSFNHLKLRIRSRTDWFEMSGELAVDEDRALNMKQLLDLIRTSDSRFIPLGNGEFLALTQELRRRLEELDAYSDRRGKDVRINPLAALAVQDLTDRLRNLDADEEWFVRIRRIADSEKIVPVVPSTMKAELRDYQVDGFRWLARLAHMGMGACLADDMGLGKTLQALGILLHRARSGPALVIAPTSVCLNWAEEARRFAPTLNLHLFGGSERENLVQGLQPFDVLICSYGLLQQESEILAAADWSTIVLDEAQAIKNMSTKRSQAAMRLKGEFKLITTGTPIENHLGELWNLFNFINPGLLGSYDSFNQRFAIPIEKYSNKDARKRLKKLIQPFILRRSKSQVLDELPPKTEVVLQVEMSSEESAFYEALRRQALERLEADNDRTGQKHLRILAEIMKLRQACCNPRLVFPDMSLPSSKLELFGSVVGELMETGHKALVFSQFVGHLNLIREYLDGQGVNYRYLDGSTPPRERKKEVDAFQAGEGDLFLISLKAGGLGINLTAADYVIHMDPWWNPAVEDQASDRAHRIGQEHPVTIYRLVTKGTIEEKIVKLHEEKKELANTLLEGTDSTGKISTEELLQLIRER